MLFPALDDTILAVSTGWQASPLAIVRLSGADCFALAEAIGARRPPADAALPRFANTNLSAAHLPPIAATAYWFAEPRSYTGQDLVELHMPGCLPLVRALCDELLRRGARRALPGEFTARAFLAGKLSAEQVENVQALLQASGAANNRIRERASRVSVRALLEHARNVLADLIARLEAGIDFVEEEDVRFITGAEVHAALAQLLTQLPAATEPAAELASDGWAHVALVGLPNAGKSTLFNALIGQERAIVSPVVGTTRDVLSAPLDLAGVQVQLQDCAGLGSSEADLEAAAHQAAERAAEHADLVLWVHAVDERWHARELHVLEKITPRRCVVVRSKADLAPASKSPAFDAAAVVSVSVAAGTGLGELRAAVRRALAAMADTAPGQVDAERIAALRERLAAAAALLPTGSGEFRTPELVALELRSAYELVWDSAGGALVEEVLERVFTQFCVGK